MSDGSEESGEIVVERRSPKPVFSLLGNDTRVEILQGLSETPDEAVPFSALHHRVGIRDSGQFNYHLGQLQGTFVRQTDDGYRLTLAGRQIVGAMLAGTYTANATIDPFPVDGSCLLCGGTVTASYDDEVAVVECTECGEWANELPFPPGSLDQFERAELPHAFDSWLQLTLQGTIAGFCLICSGRTTGTLVPDSGTDAADGVGPHIEYRCGRCGSTTRVSVPLPVLFHPAVQGFIYDQGIDLGTQPTWQLRDVLDPDLTIHEEPARHATVRFTGTDDILAVEIDATAAVTSVERQPLPTD